MLAIILPQPVRGFCLQTPKTLVRRNRTPGIQFRATISPMSRSPQEILEEALQLRPDQIDWLVESLLIKESISDGNEPQAEIEAAWDSEIKRRLDEIDSGAVEMIPGDQVRAEMISALSPHARARRRA